MESRELDALSNLRLVGRGPNRVGILGFFHDIKTPGNIGLPSGSISNLANCSFMS
jgi:hypothetical protein